MFVRIVTANTTKGPTDYVQLCHNNYDPETKRSKTQVLYNFGRADALDVDAIWRLIKSLSRFLPTEEAAQIENQLGEELPIEFLGSRQLGGPWLLQGMWQRLGIGEVLRRLLGKRAYQTDMERMIFAMVANRALAPSSKLYLEHWVAEEAFMPELPEVEVHQLYRTMDFLLEAAEPLQRAVFNTVADLFNLEVDLLFLDTTTTYFEVAEEDGEEADGEAGLRKRSRESKDRRPDLPQVVVGFAVTRDGIPIRSWVWPGNTSDQTVVQEVKQDLSGWRLGRVVLVEDTGFNSAKNREEAKFDGKFLVSTSDDGLSVEDVALGYKQLFEIERVFYDLKHLIDIRPVRHRLPERIRAHVLLCWLAMLLIRLAENETGQTWFQMKKHLAGLQLGMHRAASGEIWQRNDLRQEAKELFERLQIKPPPRYLKMPTPAKQDA